MITNKRQHIQISILLIVGAFVAAHICFWILPNLFEMWNAKAIDRLFLFRSSSSYFQPQYNDTIVHVDITDTSLKRLGTFYLNRFHYARVIRNLGKMNVSAQMYDFIFAARSDHEEDRALIEATKEAGNIYYGMAFNLEKKRGPKSQQLKRDSKEVTYLELTEWNVVVDGDTNDLYEGVKPVITFPELASVSKGLGYLNIKTDPDGVNRRIPLLVRYKGAFYPGFAFRGICDYLHVTPGNIGSEKRTKYGAVGSPINMTYRVESHTIGGQILISTTTYQRIQSRLLIQDTTEVRFKGIDQPMTLYDVNGIKGKYEVSLHGKGPEEFRSLDAPLAITYFVLEGKAISERAIPGQITGLSPSGAEASLDKEVGLLSNLKILLVSTETSSLSEIYAKVTSIDPPATSSPHVHVCLRFTSLPEDTKHFLDKTFQSSLSTTMHIDTENGHGTKNRGI